MREIRSYFDHFCCCIENRQSTEELLHKLGFVYGNSAADDHIHMMFERGYMEFTTYRADEKLPSGKDGFVKVNMEPHSTMITLFLGSKDLTASHQALKDAGYPVLDPMVPPFQRRAKHGTVKGMGVFHCFMFSDSFPFDKKTVFGTVQHGTPNLIYENRFIHVNNAANISKLMFVARDADRATQFADCMEALTEQFEPSADPYHTIPHVVIMDAKEYEAYFATPYTGDKDVDLAAVCFDGCDKQYLSEQLHDTDVRHFPLGECIVVDSRKQFGMFLIFA